MTMTSPGRCNRRGVLPAMLLVAASGGGGARAQAQVHIAHVSDDWAKTYLPAGLVKSVVPARPIIAAKPRAGLPLLPSAAIAHPVAHSATRVVVPAAKPHAPATIAQLRRPAAFDGHPSAVVAATHVTASLLPKPAMVVPAAAAFSFTGTLATQQAMHLTVGHVMFLNTRTRVRRIYIANPAVLDSYTVNPNQIVVTAKAPGLSSVVVWDQNDECQTYMVSSDIDVDQLRASMKQAFPGEVLQVEGREAKVVLSGTVGTDAVSDAAVKMATLYSKEISSSLLVNPARIKQVRLKVRIVEVDRSKLDQFGINIFNPAGTTAAGGSTSQFPTTATITTGGGSSSGAGGTGSNGQSLTLSDPLNFFFYSFKNNIGLTVRDLENRQVLQILAEPTISTLSGQKASFLAGGEFPFPVVQGGAGGQTSISVQFRTYGVKLEFTPVVNADGSIELKVIPEVSALDFTNAVTISGYTIPALSTKRADTQVVLRSGQSFAISGLLDRRTTDAFSKTPGIASIPVLGQLFKSKGVNLSTSELIVVVTPTVIDPLTDTAETLDEPAPVVPFLKKENFDNALPAGYKKP